MSAAGDWSYGGGSSGGGALNSGKQARLTGKTAIKRNNAIKRVVQKLGGEERANEIKLAWKKMSWAEGNSDK